MAERLSGDHCQGSLIAYVLAEVAGELVTVELSKEHRVAGELARGLGACCWFIHGSWRRGAARAATRGPYIVRIIRNGKNRLGEQIFQNFFVMMRMAQGRLGSG